MNVPEFKSFLSRNKGPIAITAPLFVDDITLIGFHSPLGESGCVEVPRDELQQVAAWLYQPQAFPMVVHGLKRIWESLELNIDEVDFKLITDTKLMAYLLDPDAGEGGGLTLTHLAYQYLGRHYPHMAVEVRDRGVQQASQEALMRYAGIIWSLGKELPRHMSKDLYRLYRDLELPLMVVLHRMRRVGIGVDGAAAIKERIRVTRELSDLEQRIKGGQEINLMSPSEVYHFLIRQGVRFKSDFVYPTRRVTTAALEEIAFVYPIVQDVLDWRGMVTDLAFLTKAAERERVHPTWQQTRAGTSRIYARDPAVQNVSRALRHLFVPAEGMVLIKADYSQAQLRILAHLSGDKGLLDLFNEGRDVHAETAQWLGVDREAAKEVNFGICFGISAAGLCGKINAVIGQKNRYLPQNEQKRLIKDTEAQTYIDGFYSGYSGVNDFFEQEWN
jgi:DNA polymerase I-like protein with 3'-5' exonuclease and polymerase domains